MLKHAISEGFKNIIRSFWLSATTVTILTISLIAAAFAVSFVNVVAFSVNQLDKEVSIPVFFKDGVEEDRINEMKSEVEEIAEVSFVQKISNEEAKEELLDNPILTDIEQTINDNEINIEFGYLNVFPEKSEFYRDIHQVLTSQKYAEIVSDVPASEDLIDRLQSIYRIVNIVGSLFILFFAFVSVLMMVNMLRITVYNHRTEIEIMRLVGATNNYIRSPFVAEALIFSLISAIITLIIFIPSINVALPQIQFFFRVGADDVGLLTVQLYGGVIATGVVSILVGGITSFFATQRYLKG